MTMGSFLLAQPRKSMITAAVSGQKVLTEIMHGAWPNM